MTLTAMASKLRLEADFATIGATTSGTIYYLTFLRDVEKYRFV